MENARHHQQTYSADWCEFQDGRHWRQMSRCNIFLHRHPIAVQSIDQRAVRWLYARHHLTHWHVTTRPSAPQSRGCSGTADGSRTPDEQFQSHIRPTMMMVNQIYNELWANDDESCILPRPLTVCYKYAWVWTLHVDDPLKRRINKLMRVVLIVLTRLFALWLTNNKQLTKYQDRNDDFRS